MSEPKYTRLGNEIRAARKTRGYSLRGLAGMLGCEHQRIILWEKGANKPNRRYRAMLTVLLGITDFSADVIPMDEVEAGADMRTERRLMERVA